MKFCDKLSKLRKNNNMSQEQLADKLGVSRQAVSKWESGSSLPDMAKILEHQVETRKELNEKIDKLILQNNVEHKKFAYQIAQLEMNEGFTKIG